LHVPEVNDIIEYEPYYLRVDRKNAKCNKKKGEVKTTSKGLVKYNPNALVKEVQQCLNQLKMAMEKAALGETTELTSPFHGDFMKHIFTGGIMYKEDYMINFLTERLVIFSYYLAVPPFDIPVSLDDCFILKCMEGREESCDPNQNIESDDTAIDFLREVGIIGDDTRHITIKIRYYTWLRQNHPDRNPSVDHTVVAQVVQSYKKLFK
jgi:hypothetical protein